MGGSSLNMGPIALLKGNKKNKGKAKDGGIEGLSIREQRNMSGTPDPVFNPVSMDAIQTQATSTLTSLFAQDVIEWDEQTIVGTSRQLEKPYLRLTSVSTTNQC